MLMIIYFNDLAWHQVPSCGVCIKPASRRAGTAKAFKALATAQTPATAAWCALQALLAVRYVAVEVLRAILADAVGSGVRHGYLTLPRAARSVFRARSGSHVWLICPHRAWFARGHPRNILVMPMRTVLTLPCPTFRLPAARPARWTRRSR